VQKLLDGIAAAEGSRVLVRLITRRRIRAIGTLPQTGTKHGRAHFLAERFPELQAFLPPVRKLWMPEDDRMSIFDAVSFALACLLAQPTEARAPEKIRSESQPQKKRPP